MFRKPLFWITSVVLALGCILFTLNYFPKAFPVVTVDITMDRQTAIDRAEEMAYTFGWGPTGDYRLAASYNLNNRVQNYVELEAGGAGAFRELLDSGLYSPYTWEVRIFRELEANETLVRFTPRGEPWGFVETLPENEPGAAIPADSARTIAEEVVTNSWNVNLESFSLVESSENLHPGGRLDHTFVYERLDEKIGEAEYRLRLRVGGDKLTELTRFVQVPEAFDRRYEELRSDNHALASTALIAAVILFGLIGCGFGLFYLLKNRYVTWKQPVLASTIIAFLVMLTMFNSWPLQWMDYDTALSYQNHVIKQIAAALLSFAGMAILFSIIFMAAESLTRKAFPDHINFWKLWSRGVASTRQVLGITFSALLLVCFELSYVTGTYYFTSNILGWWYPSSTLFNPDVIAEYFPWLTALAISLQAAFWEEALFRAIPIAGAVLIGQKHGKTTLWVIAAFVLQAVIFGAAHADYPQQPFYARTVELIFPSIVFGLVYYFLGLYPAILIHFWYNFVWFSISVFATSVPGILTSQIIIIVIGLMPFWIILFQWFRTKRLDDVSEDALNSAWVPEVESTLQEPETFETTRWKNGTILSPGFLKIITAAGFAGFVLWLLFSDFGKDAPPVESTRSEAVLLAEQELTGQNIELDDTWQAFSRVYGGITMQHRFIWQEGGPEIYNEMLGSYLDLPEWYVRFLTFEGDVEERAEEFRIFISRKDSTTAFRHILPEHRAGASLEESEAREIADQTIRDVHAVDPETLQFVSAESSSLPERTDWHITYSDTLSYPLEEGEARIQVRIAGNEIVGTNRFIHVPEEWSRQYRDNRTIPDTVEMAASILSILLFLAAIITAIIRWSKGKFSGRAFFILTGIALLIAGINTYNIWPLTQIGFSTAQPYTSQALTSIGFSTLGWGVVSITYGLLGGLIHRWNLPVSNELTRNTRNLFIAAVFPVLAVLGLFALVSGLTPQTTPYWGNAGISGASNPFLAGFLSPFTGFFSDILILIFLYGSVHHFTAGWQKKRVLFGILLFLAGFPAVGNTVESIGMFLLTGTIAGVLVLLFYIYLLRHHMALIVLMVASYTIIADIGSLITPMYPGEAVAWIFSSVLIGVIAWFWHNSLVQNRQETGILS
jgi:hypothetical protein